MRFSVAWLVIVLVAVLGCGPAEEFPTMPASRIDLPAGAAPVVLAGHGADGLLIGVRRDQVPGLLRRAGDGAVTEIPVAPASPYGKLALWYSIVSDGDRIVAIGGERGGAHSNVRWSVWNGTAAGLAEQPQGFSTFGGWGAGELVDAVQTPHGPALIGSWGSASAGLDIAVWTNADTSWNRQDSAGTALQSTLDGLNFPISATALDQGVLIAGWRLTPAGQPAAVWRSGSGVTGWTVAELPGAGRVNAALAVRCWESTCGVAGRVDNRLAVWQFSGGQWTRLPDVPPAPVGDNDKVVAPVWHDGALTQVYTEGDRVWIARWDGQTWSTPREVSGPTGRVTAAVVVGGALYLLAGPDENSQLFRLFGD
ncbi:MAG TPA: hypothetical protein VFV67_33245 [Actinophytocola sp.]|uniref:hypothetical protein n=1 Tax=Actinophytocola sp. TaxID=1872138 RepID=UPI002DB58E87|nr:hypothetical protein [Actinophytocola sp.]HEU5475535.1 hypothetical protein [Actinophytocola sp.]